MTAPTVTLTLAEVQQDIAATEADLTTLRARLEGYRLLAENPFGAEHHMEFFRYINCQQQITQCEADLVNMRAALAWLQGEPV